MSDGTERCSGCSRATFHEGEPVLDRDSKTLMLVSHHGDTIRLDGFGEFTVTRRTDAYFGPKLRLSDDEGDSYRLVAPGFAQKLELWKDVEDEDGFIAGKKRIGETTGEVVDVAKGAVCDCGELLTSLDDRRAAVVGVCPHNSKSSVMQGLDGDRDV